MIQFDVKLDESQQQSIIRVSGEIDLHTCPDLQKVLQDAINKGDKQLVLNLESIQYIDSTGLGTIAQAAKNLSNKDGEILVICNQPQIRKIFEISGLNKKNIKLFDAESAAIRAIKKPN